MKVLAAGGLAVSLLGAVLAALSSGLTRQVDALRSRLDTSESDLCLARLEIEHLRLDNLEMSDRMGADMKARVAQMETRTRSEALGVMRALTRDVEALYRDVLHPSVQVSGRGGVGGGTLLYSRGGSSFVISAYHVVQRAPA